MIPKVIHYCWFGHGEMPETEKKCVASWKKVCPDYEIKRWDETNYDVSKIVYIKEAYEAKKWSFVSDYARLDILYQYGGFYFDTDVELLRNLDELLEEKAFMGFESTGYVAPGLGMGAEVRNPMIRLLMQAYEQKHFVNENGRLDLVTIPVVTTEILIQNGLIANNKYQKLKEITVYPTDYFCPLDYDTGILNVTENTYSIHHYSASWAPEEQVKERAIRNQMVEKYGRERGLKIAKIVNIPNRLKFHFKTKGIAGTIKFAVSKVLGREK